MNRFKPDERGMKVYRSRFLQYECLRVLPLLMGKAFSYDISTAPNI